MNHNLIWCTYNYDAISRNVFCCVRQINILSIYLSIDIDIDIDIDIYILILIWLYLFWFWFWLWSDIDMTMIWYWYWLIGIYIWYCKREQKLRQQAYSWQFRLRKQSILPKNMCQYQCWNFAMIDQDIGEKVPPTEQTASVLIGKTIGISNDSFKYDCHDRWLYST